MPKKSSDSLKIWQNWVSSCTGNCDGIPPASCSGEEEEEKKRHPQCVLAVACYSVVTLARYFTACKT